MELVLYRHYHPAGTNGELYYKGERICYTIELPWQHNAVNTSCIPEGRYVLVKKCSPEHGQHWQVTGVDGRSSILMHPANNALLELKGCIAPVSILTGEGLGSDSRKAFELVMQHTLSASPGEAIVLNIKKII